jgi:hypothetical protein
MHSTLTQHFGGISIPPATTDCAWNWVELWLNDVNQLVDLWPML